MLPRILTGLFLLLALIVPGLAAERPPHIVFMIGENEYDTKTTVPAFAKAELEPRGVKCTFAIAPNDDSNEFPGLEALKDADLLFVSVRRRIPSPEMMALIRAHVAAGKPVVGIRTASHAFAQRKTEGPWQRFDQEVLGGNYQDHYGKNIVTFGKIVPAQAEHPVLAGIGAAEFKVPSHLYKNPNLPETSMVLMTARMEGRPEVEPIAWVKTKDQQRVFYTSLGSVEDFAVPQFRTLLLNGFFWALNRPVPAAKSAAAQPLRSGQTQAAALPAAEAAKSFTVAEDLQIEQVLAEPQVEKPVFLNFDERGRMWVVEYRQYPEPAGLKVLSHDSFWRAVYDKVPQPPPNHVRGRDRISIHEDADGDGVYESHKVFLDGLNICTAVERGRGGVWVLHPPYLLFYPDKNNDDVPDGDPVVHLSGFGIEDTHSVANSLRWGPDGWLYGAHGSTVTAAIKRPELDAEPIARMQGQGIWRYEPVSKRFEVFSEGGGNTFGVEFDAKGRVFSGHNGGDTRGFHYMQGAYLRKGFDKHGPLSNPYTFGYFEAMAHAKVERFTHNFIIYEGGALGGREGRLFGAEPLQGRIVESEVTPVGSTFKTRDLERPVTSSDPWFRPVDVKAGPDGAIYVCDWATANVAHNRTYQDLADGTKLDMSLGRVYRIKRKDAAPVRAEDLGKLSSADLVKRLDTPNKWTRQTVQRLLADRQDTTLQKSLRKALSKAEGQQALELLWALNASGGLDGDAAMECIKHSDPFVRLWAVRLTGDRNTGPEWDLISFRTMISEVALKEPNVEVRAQMACTAKRLDYLQNIPILFSLISHAEDVSDPRLPLLLWWVMEHQISKDHEHALALLQESYFWDQPMMKTHLLDKVMRRLAISGTRKDLLLCAALFDRSPSVEHSKKLMQGFEAAYKGRSLSGLPEELVKAMRRHKVGSGALALRMRESGAEEEAMKTIADEKAPIQARLDYVAVLGEVSFPESVPGLLKTLGETTSEPLRKAILTALALYDDPKAGEAVVAVYPKLTKETQPVAQNLLASRAAWAGQFLAAVEAGTIASQGVPAEIVGKLKLHNALADRAEKIWAGRKANTAEMTALIARYTTALQGAVGDPYAGQTVYMNTCAACHTLHNSGGRLGPDLTNFNREDVASLLTSIVNPNAEIREGYENFFVTTKDGRLINGFLVEQDPQVVVLRGLDGQNVTVERAQIGEMKSAGASLMPEGLLQNLSEQDLRDLFSYLRITQPLVVKKS